MKSAPSALASRRTRFTINGQPVRIASGGGSPLNGLPHGRIVIDELTPGSQYSGDNMGTVQHSRGPGLYFRTTSGWKLVTGVRKIEFRREPGNRNWGMTGQPVDGPPGPLELRFEIETDRTADETMQQLTQRAVSQRGAEFVLEFEKDDHYHQFRGLFTAAERRGTSRRDELFLTFAVTSAQKEPKPGVLSSVVGYDARDHSPASVPIREMMLDRAGACHVCGGQTYITGANGRPEHATCAAWGQDDDEAKSV